MLAAEAKGPRARLGVTTCTSDAEHGTSAPASIPVGPTTSQVAGSAHHTWAILPEGDGTVWGDNSRGQLGDGTGWRSWLAPNGRAGEGLRSSATVRASRVARWSGQ